MKDLENISLKIDSYLPKPETAELVLTLAQLGLNTEREARHCIKQKKADQMDAKRKRRYHGRCGLAARGAENFMFLVREGYR